MAGLSWRGVGARAVEIWTSLWNQLQCEPHKEFAMPTTPPPENPADRPSSTPSRNPARVPSRSPGEPARPSGPSGSGGASRPPGSGASRSSSSRPAKRPEPPVPLWLMSGAPVVIVLAVLVVGLTYNHRTQSAASADVAESPDTQVEAPAPVWGPGAPPPAYLTAIPIQEALYAAMKPGADEQKIAISSLKMLKCTPTPNALAVHPVGEARCNVEIVAARDGGAAKTLQVEIHVAQDANGAWRALPR